jgi:hypothetical protein
MRNRPNHLQDARFEIVNLVGHYWGGEGKIAEGTDLTEIPIEWMSAT